MSECDNKAENGHFDEASIHEVLEILSVEQLLTISRRLRLVLERKHGEVGLIVKNGKLTYIDTRLSEDIRKS
jgi:hypothetical protein